MFSELYVAGSGMKAIQEQVDTIAHNLANASTPAFKMEEVILQEIALAGGEGTEGAPSQVRVAGRRTDFSLGGFEFTGESLNLALGENSFLVVQSPQGTLLTRDGRLSLDRDGRLVLHGNPVMGDQGEIRLGDSIRVHIAQDGQVIGDSGVAGKLKIVTLSQPWRLEKVASGLYRVPEGIDIADDPNPVVYSGYLEHSNVNPIKCMVRLIEALRAFELQQKMVQTSDSLGQRAVQELARVA